MKNKPNTIQELLREVNENRQAKRQRREGWEFMAKFLLSGLGLSGAAVGIFALALEMKIFG
jgi:hypothetical protein